MGNGRVIAVVGMGLALAVAGASACGGSESSVTPTQTNDAGGGGADAGEADGGDGYTLDDVCEKVAPKICALRRPCCEKTHGWDEAGCLSEAKSDCAKDVADARGGRATFHPDRIDPCLDKYKPIFDACTLTFDLLVTAYPTLKDCNIFEGQLAEGASCERGSQCKPAAAANEIATCDDDTKLCKITTLVGEGGGCSFASGLATLCAEGLHCDVDLAVNPPAGVCKKKTALGQPCDAAKLPLPLECGLGNYCSKATALCTAGKGGGAPCDNDLECASVACRAVSDAGVDAGKACEAPKPLPKPEECKGP